MEGTASRLLRAVSFLFFGGLRAFLGRLGFRGFWGVLGPLGASGVLDFRVLGSMALGILRLQGFLALGFRGLCIIDFWA